MAKKATTATAAPNSGRAFFKALVKSIGDPDTHFAEDGTASAEFTGGTDTGSYILNAALCGSLFGGAPNNKIIGFAGDPATGKCARGSQKIVIFASPETADRIKSKLR